MKNPQGHDWYFLGAHAFHNGRSIYANPCVGEEAQEWFDGWYSAEEGKVSKVEAEKRVGKAPVHRNPTKAGTRRRRDLIAKGAWHF